MAAVAAQALIVVCLGLPDMGTSGSTVFKPQSAELLPAQVQGFADDPLTFKGNLRVRTATELVRGFVDIRQHRSQLRMPVFAQHGTADKITSCKAPPACISASAALPSSI